MTRVSGEEKLTVQIAIGITNAVPDGVRIDMDEAKNIVSFRNLSSVLVRKQSEEHTRNRWEVFPDGEIILRYPQMGTVIRVDCFRTMLFVSPRDNSLPFFMVVFSHGMMQVAKYEEGIVERDTFKLHVLEALRIIRETATLKPYLDSLSERDHRIRLLMEHLEDMVPAAQAS